MSTIQELLNNPNISERKKQSLLNLRPARKGEVHNPRGRPKSRDCLLDCIKKEAGVLLPDRRTKEQHLAELWWEMALKGDKEIGRMLLEHIAGRPRQQIDLGGQVDNPLKVYGSVVIGEAAADKPFKEKLGNSN